MDTMNAKRTASGWERPLRLAILFAIGATWAADAMSQELNPIPPLAVITDVADSPECRVLPASLEAAVKAAMRYNRIGIDSDRLGSSAVYIQVNAIPAGSGMCAASLDVSVNAFRSVPMPDFPTVPGVKRVMLCDRGEVVHWPGNELQGMLNSDIRDFFDECVTEISDD